MLSEARLHSASVLKNLCFLFFKKILVFYLKIFQSRTGLLAAPLSDSVLTDRHLQPHLATGVAAEHFTVFSLPYKTSDAVSLPKKQPPPVWVQMLLVLKLSCSSTSLWPPAPPTSSHSERATLNNQDHVRIYFCSHNDRK